MNVKIHMTYTHMRTYNVHESVEHSDRVLLSRTPHGADAGVSRLVAHLSAVAVAIVGALVLLAAELQH